MHAFRLFAPVAFAVRVTPLFAFDASAVRLMLLWVEAFIALPLAFSVIQSFGMAVEPR